jgi:hypothetical protein
VKVGNNIAEAWLEPIRNPVTGQIHRAIIEIPGGFEVGYNHFSVGRHRYNWQYQGRG